MHDKPTQDVGEKLKTLRKRYGLSQRQLAEKAGLTHGTVSFIERNKISPSIGTLRQILDSISMTLSDFFSETQEGEVDFFYSREDLLEVGSGGVSLLQIGQNLNGLPLQILLERYPPGAETASTPYRCRSGEEGGFVIEGEIELTVNGRTRILIPNEGYLFPVHLEHRMRNIGDVDCVIVSACTPPA
ncbi:MAG: cupin domain-containing protein [Halioglobus sp.]